MESLIKGTHPPRGSPPTPGVRLRPSRNPRAWWGGRGITSLTRTVPALGDPPAGTPRGKKCPPHLLCPQAGICDRES